MSARTFLLSFFATCVVLLCSCSQPERASNFESSIASVQRYCHAFVGKDIEEMRESFAGSQLAEGRWSEDGFGGAELVATYPRFEVRILFLDDEAITGAITVLSD